MKAKDTKVFEEDNRIYKFYVNSAVNDAKAVDFIRDLFKIELIDLDKTENQDLLQLYEIVGFDKFFELVAFFSSKTVKFPKLDKIKRLLITAIAYYQTEILGLSAKDAGKILSDRLGLLKLKQKNVKLLVNKLQQDIEYISNNTLKKLLAEQATNEKVGESNG